MSWQEQLNKQKKLPIQPMASVQEVVSAMVDTMYERLLNVKDLKAEVVTSKFGSYTAEDLIDSQVEAKLKPIIAKEIQNMVNKMNKLMEMKE
jgi:hypothetical protein